VAATSTSSAPSTAEYQRLLSLKDNKEVQEMELTWIQSADDLLSRHNGHAKTQA